MKWIIFWTTDKDHVHFHICTEYFCWLWKAIYFFNYKCFFIHTDVVARFLLCFSLIQNTNRILSTKVPPGAITSINGMRVLSMWWVILGHCYFFMLDHRPSKLFHIFLPRFSQKFTLEEEIILVGSNCFNILDTKRAFCATPGLRSVSVLRYERGVVFLSLGWLGHYTVIFKEL